MYPIHDCIHDMFYLLLCCGYDHRDEVVNIHIDEISEILLIIGVWKVLYVLIVYTIADEVMGW